METGNTHMKKYKQLQQGDVTITRLTKMPLGTTVLVSKKRCVLAHGESGHSHVIEDDEAQLIQIGERMLLKLTKSATVVHEEHKPIKLQPGIWEIGRVREHDYLANMSRQVMD
jgi:hypothetical protein